MTFELVYARQAQRQLEKLNPRTALRIVEGCERLKRNPFPDGKHVKKLKGMRSCIDYGWGIFAWCFNGLEAVST